jgi:hypothetical protein
LTYFPDLSPCTYFGAADANKLIAVGWLDEAYPYSQGQVSQDFIGRLFELLAKPWAPVAFLGFHECSWCGDDDVTSHNRKPVAVGVNNLFVPGAGFLYVMPSLVAHYV